MADLCIDTYFSSVTPGHGRFVEGCTSFVQFRRIYFSRTLFFFGRLKQRENLPTVSWNLCECFCPSELALALVCLEMDVHLFFFGFFLL